MVAGSSAEAYGVVVSGRASAGRSRWHRAIPAGAPRGHTGNGGARGASGAASAAGRVASVTPAARQHAKSDRRTSFCVISLSFEKQAMAEQTPAQKARNSRTPLAHGQPKPN